MIKTYLFQHFHRLFLGGPVSADGASKVDGKAYIFLDRHDFEWPHDLVGADDAPPHQRGRLFAGYVLAAQVYLACRRTNRSGDYAEECGLTGAIGPDETTDMFFRDFKTHVFQGGDASKVLCQSLYLQNLHGGS